MKPGSTVDWPPEHKSQRGTGDELREPGALAQGSSRLDDRLDCTQQESDVGPQVVVLGVDDEHCLLAMEQVVELRGVYTFAVS